MKCGQLPRDLIKRIKTKRTEVKCFKPRFDVEKQGLTWKNMNVTFQSTSWKLRESEISSISRDLERTRAKS